MQRTIRGTPQLLVENRIFGSNLGKSYIRHKLLRHLEATSPFHIPSRSHLIRDQNGAVGMHTRVDSSC